MKLHNEFGTVMVGRAVLCPPPPVNERILVHYVGAHGVTRPTFPGEQP